MNRPEPVMNASYLAGALITFVKVILVMLVTLGWVDLDDGQQATITATVTAAIDLFIIVGTMYFGARSKVTPTEDPRDDQGRPLRVNWNS